ncbi:biotin--[acetyl-CoA-carboxylase] ligase [Alicyclobacillus suci]|uniref:biotin--[acetyl-CoA-carboxylase] ligase n=1 Tax=Alicyclobacillus suci TaxID=2816080 RepID=UPI002E29AB43|nr:biotin--[acetyl-CoA-carboxylase] ligase [Alicyclobacillus suci]
MNCLAKQDWSTRDKMLELFMSAPNRTISGEQLSAALNVSRTAIWKQIKTLESNGFEFSATPRVGYRLTHVPDELIGPLVSPHLNKACRLGQTILWAPERISTNDTAIELAHEGAVHGLVVTAARQTGGRGRQGRAWQSPAGGMWFSVLVRNPCALSQAGDLTLLASVAVHRALHESGVETKIKWPNDILVDGRKICGILAQMRADGETVDYAVIGIGINANFHRDALPPDVSDHATTILTECGQPVDRPLLLARILNQLDTLYSSLAQGAGGFAAVREEWKTHAHTLGRTVHVRLGDTFITGYAEDVDERGVLLVRDYAGVRHELHSGEVLFSTSEKL